MEENNQQNQTQINPVPTPAGKSKLPLILIAIFVLLIILGLGGYLLKSILSINLSVDNFPIPYDSPTIAQNSPTPTIDETASPDRIGANWKTYTNTKLGFKLKYPLEYTIEEEGESKVSFSGLFSETQKAPRSLVITTKLTDLSKIKTCEESNWDPKILCFTGKTENTNLDDRPAIVFGLMYPGGGFGTTTRIQTINDPKIEIYATIYSGGGGARFDQILSTFRFDELTASKSIDQNQTIDTSNWKTYSSEFCHLSVMYPPSWQNRTPGDISNGCIIQLSESIKGNPYKNIIINNILNTTWDQVISRNKNNEKITVASTEGIKIKDDLSLKAIGATQVGFYFHKGDLIFEFIAIYKIDDKETGSIVQGVITSIKFTD